MTAVNGQIAKVRLTPQLVDIVSVLWRASGYAKGTSLDKWQFAVEVEELQRLGYGKSELRWLLASGCARQALEITREGDQLRRFKSIGGHVLTQRACLVLTAKGEGIVKSLGELRAGSMRNHFGLRRALHWDVKTLSLRVGNQVIKRFRFRAPNQIAILTAFDEEGWPERIDDPLCGRKRDAKRRLHDTIKCLNQRHYIKLLRFHGDGTGEGVIWEPV